MSVADQSNNPDLKTGVPDPGARRRDVGRAWMRSRSCSLAAAARSSPSGQHALTMEDHSVKVDRRR
jgi:hypothetical protein